LMAQAQWDCPACTFHNNIIHERSEKWQTLNPAQAPPQTPEREDMANSRRGLLYALRAMSDAGLAQGMRELVVSFLLPITVLQKYNQMPWLFLEPPGTEEQERQATAFAKAVTHDLVFGRTSCPTVAQLKIFFNKIMQFQWERAPRTAKSLWLAWADHGGEGRPSLDAILEIQGFQLKDGGMRYQLAKKFLDELVVASRTRHPRAGARLSAERQ
jgi:hypothetical protein